MTTHRFPTLALLTTLPLFAACAAGPVMVQDIEPLGDAWEAAYEAGDEDALAALYTDDAVVLLADVEPLRGADAIRAYYADTPPGLDVETTTETVLGEGDHGHARGQYTVRSGDNTVARGNWTLVLARDGDDWKIRQHVAVSDLPTEEQAALMMMALSPIASAYEVAYNSQNRVALAELYTRDALLLPPHAEPIRGRDAIREALIVQPGTTVDIDLHHAIDLGANAHGYGMVTFSTPDGTVLDRANWSGVFVPEGGTWKIDRMMWSSEMPLTASASEALRAAVETANLRFESAARDGNAGLLASLYTDDGVLLPPSSGPVHGRTAIETYFQGAFDAGVAAIDLETDEVSGLGDLVVETGQYTMSGPAAGVMDEGKYLVVWKQEDGEWRLHRDIWNTSQSPQGTY